MIEIAAQTWDPAQDPVDFRKITTPGTTYALVFMHDYKAGEHPAYTRQWMEEIYSKFSDNVKVILDNEATIQAFADQLAEGIKWHCFMFYENAHGSTRALRFADGHFKAQQMWDIIKDAQKVIFGIFDSCYSESMILDNDGLMQADADGGLDFAEWIVKQYAKKRMAMMAAGDPRPLPLVEFWAATQDKHISEYTPYNHTVFSSAIKGGLRKIFRSNASPKAKPGTYREDDTPRVRDWWAIALKGGTQRENREEDDPQRTIPQRSSFGDGIYDTVVVQTHS